MRQTIRATAGVFLLQAITGGAVITKKCMHKKPHGSFVHQSLQKVVLITLGLLFLSICYVKPSHADYITIKKAEVASNGIVALETNYSIRQHQIRLLDPVKKRIFARIKLDSVEENTFFSSLLADESRFVFQLKRGFDFGGVYAVDSSAKVKKLGEVPHKLQAVTQNWFLHIKDDQFSSPVRYDKEYKKELPGHIPGHPELVVFHSQRDRAGTWLACVEITEPAERSSGVKGKLFLAYLADDDTATVYPVNSPIAEIIHQQLYVSVGKDEIWLSANGKLFVLDRKSSKQRIYKGYGGLYSPVASIAGNNNSAVLMVNNRDVIDVAGNQGHPLIARPKRTHQITPLISTSSRSVMMIQRARLPGEEPEPPKPRPPAYPKLPELPDYPPYLPDGKFQLIDLKYLEEKLDLLNIQPLFVSNKTLWCKANNDGKYYWVRLSLEEAKNPEVAEMKITVAEDIAEIAENVGSLIIGVFTGPF